MSDIILNIGADTAQIDKAIKSISTALANIGKSGLVGNDAVNKAIGDMQTIADTLEKELKSAVKDGLQGADGASKEVAKSLEKVGEAQKNASNHPLSKDSLLGGLVTGGMAGIAMKASEMLMGALSNIGGAVVGAAEKMIETNKEFETFRTQLTTLTGSADVAEQRIKELAKFGAETPFELPELVRAEKVLLGFGLSGQRAIEMTGRSSAQLRTIVGDIAAGTGQAFEEVALLFGKFSSGASGEAISRLQELGVVTREELKNLGIAFDSAGSLKSPIAKALPAALSIAQEKFGGGMKALSETASGQLSTLQDNIDTLFRDIGTPIFEIFKDIVAGLNNFFGSSTFDTIKSALKSLIEGIGNFVRGAQEKFGSLLATMKPIVEFISKALGTGLSEVFQNIMTVGKVMFDVVGTQLSVLFGIVKQFIGTMEGSSAFADNIASSFKRWGETLRAVIELLGSLAKGLITLLATPLQAIAGIVESVIRWFGSFFTTTQQTGQAVQQTGEKVLTFAEHLKNLRGWVEGLTAMFNVFKDSIGATFKAISLVISDFSLDKLMSLPNTLQKIWSDNGQKTTDAWNGVWNDMAKSSAQQAEASKKEQEQIFFDLYDTVKALQVTAKDKSKEQILDEKKRLAERIKIATQAKEITEKQQQDLEKLLKGVNEGGYTSALQLIQNLQKEMAKGLMIDDDVSKQVGNIRTVIEAEKDKNRITLAERKRLYELLEKIEKNKPKSDKDQQEELAKLRADVAKSKSEAYIKSIEDEKKKELEAQKAKEQEEIAKVQKEVKALQANTSYKASIKEEMLKLYADKERAIEEIGERERFQILVKYGQKQYEEVKKQEQELLKARNETTKRQIEALTEQVKASPSVAGLEQLLALRLEQAKRTAETELKGIIEGTQEYKQAEVKIKAKIDGTSFTVADADTQLNALRNKVADTLKSGVGEAGFAYVNALKQANDAELKTRKEHQKAVTQFLIDSQASRIERERLTKLQAIEDEYATERTKAGDNESKKLVALHQYNEARKKLNQEYLLYSQKATEVADGVVQNASSILLSSLTNITAEIEKAVGINDEQQKQLQTEEQALKESLQKRETSYEEYARRLAEIDAKRTDLQALQISSIGGLLESTAKQVQKSIGEALGLASTKQIEQFQDTAKQGSIAYETLAVSASLQFGALVASGESAGKAMVRATFNTLKALVPILSAQIFGLYTASPNPVNVLGLGIPGATAAGVMTAILTGLLSIAEASIGAEQGVIGITQSYNRRKGRTDTIPLMVAQGESIINAGATRKHRLLLEHINSGKSLEQFDMGNNRQLQAVIGELNNLNTRMARIEVINMRTVRAVQTLGERPITVQSNVKAVVEQRGQW